MSFEFKGKARNKVSIDRGGTIMWSVGKGYHREDGPAIAWLNGSKSWWLEWMQLTEEEHAVGVSGG